MERITNFTAASRCLAPQAINADEILSRPTCRDLEEALSLGRLEQRALALIEAVGSVAATDAIAGGEAVAETFDIVTKRCA